MTDSILNARVLMVGAGTVAIAIIVQAVLRPAIIDSFRQRIFAIRRDTFLFMAKGVIRPDDPEYIFTQAYLNSLLRYAERLMFLRLVVGMRVLRDHSIRMSAPPFKVPASPDPETTKILSRIRRRATERVMLHFLESSPLAWLFVVIRLPIAVSGLMRHEGVRRSVVDAMNRIVPSERIERDIATLAASEEACPIAA